MIIEVTEIEGASRHFDFTIEPDDIALEQPNFRLTEPVRMAGEATRRAAQIEIKGNIAGAAEVDCTRCLQPINSPLEVNFDIGFVEAENFTSEKEHEVRSDDLDTDILDSNSIDLKEIAREQILLNIPEQIFCRTDCKGLCEKCGADRNLIDCKCEETETDPRWDALKNLRGVK
jgi:uncharacterized protein